MKALLLLAMAFGLTAQAATQPCYYYNQYYRCFPQYGYQSVDGTAAIPSITFSADPDTGIYRAGTNTIGFTAGGAMAFTVSPGGINLPSSGGSPSTLNYYEEATHNTTIQGNNGGTVSSSCAFRFVRVGAQVTLTAPTCNTALPGAASTILNVNSAFPSQFRPSTAVNIPVLIYNNNALQTTAYGYAQITTAGGIDVRRDLPATAYTNGVAAGFAEFSLSWSL